MSRWYCVLPFLLLALASAGWAGDVEPFFACVRAGDTEGVSRMLGDTPALLEARGADRYTALHVAAESGKQWVAALLLDKKAAIEARTRYGATPLRLAASNGHAGTCALLLDRGADITGGADDLTGQPLYRAMIYGYPEAVRVLLDHGAKLDVREADGDTPMHWAVRGLNAETVKLVLARGQAVDAKNGNGDTPAVLALRTGTAEVLAALLDAGANPNARQGDDADGRVLLRMARDNDNLAAVRVLIEHGARDTVTYLAGPGMPDPRSVRGRVYVPARWLTEWLGGTVDVQGKVVVLALGAADGRFAPIAADVVPEPDTYESQVFNGTTYVALNDLTRALKAPSVWNAVALEMTVTQPKSGERLRIAIGDPGLTGTQAQAVAKTGTHTIWLADGTLIGALVNGKPTDADDVKPAPRTLAVKLYCRSRYLGTATAQITTPKEGDPTIEIQTPLAGEYGQGIVAIDGTWAALPRPARVVPHDDAQVKRFGREVLDAYGLPKSALDVDTARLIDLDGDGTDELLVAASKHENGGSSVVRRGDYQFAAVRRAGKPLLLEGAFFKRSGIDLTACYDVLAALDIDADGTQEVLLTGDVGGGTATTVFQIGPTAATPLMTGVTVIYGDDGDMGDY